MRENFFVFRAVAPLKHTACMADGCWLAEIAYIGESGRRTQALGLIGTERTGA